MRQNANRNEGRAETGFSILEMLIASAILMVGIVSVVQLVPASLKSAVSNRMDTMATVVAQHELEQMLAQPLSVNSFTDANNNLVNLGGPNAPGAAVAMNGQSTMIDFSQDINSVPGGFAIANYVDPNDPTQTAFELRWAVYPQVNNGIVVSKRIIIGCRRAKDAGDEQLLLPVTLDTWVQK